MFTAFSIYIKRRLYNTFTRQISFDSVITIALGGIVSSVALSFSIIFLELDISLSIPLIYALLLCFMGGGIRFFVRTLGENTNQKNRKQNVAIYGAGLAGRQLLEFLKWNLDYRVCQFIDDNPELQGQTLAGIPIESFDYAKQKFKKLEIKTLITTIPSGVDKARQKILDILSEYPLQVKAIPTLTNLILGAHHISEISDIKIEDLLGRSPVQPDAQLMSKHIAGNTVLVTGAGGSIGSEICRQIINWSPNKLILLDVSEFSIYRLQRELNVQSINLSIDIIPLIGSVQDNNFVKNVMDNFTIDTIYHAAAYKHVPLMEQNIMQCIINNVFGTLNMAENAIATKVKSFILISTDKAVNPTNFMGASKRFSEIICQTFNNRQIETCFSIVRFGNVLGSSGSVVPLFKKQIKKGGPITLTHTDVTRYFMTIPEAAQLVIQAGSIAKSGEVFVLDMGSPIKILDLAKKMITLSGLKPILSNDSVIKNDEIAITISGLRPGEKLYEELSYSNNLMRTPHPRIMKTTEEATMSFDNIQALLLNVRSAIHDNDHKKFIEIIASVTNGVSDVTTSNDAFIKENTIRPNKVVSTRNQKY